MEPPSKLTAVAERPVRFAEWLFGPLAPGIDFALMLFSLGWLILGVIHPQAFNKGPFVGLRWAPIEVWEGLRLLLVVLHGVGLFRPRWRTLRVSASFLSAWYWLTVSVSLFRVDIVPGELVYLMLGAWALLAGIYLAGLPCEET